MYNYPVNQISSPTDSSSSGRSELSSISAWWHSEGASSSSSGASNSSRAIGSPVASRVRPFEQATLESPRSECARMFLSPSQSRPPHNPARYIALSSQYVHAVPHRTPMLARISVVDYRGNVLYDTFVRPTNQIEDFRSPITGLAVEQLYSSAAMDSSAARIQVASLILGKVIIGHSLWMHLSLLGLTHPAIDTRDAALYLPFHRSISTCTITPLKSLVSHLMRRKIGRTYENPLEEARAALDLFRSYEDEWEDDIREGAWPCALPPSNFGRFFS